MNLKTWVPLVLAIVLGLIAMKVARDVMDKKNPSVTSENAMKVVVLKKDVPAGTQLTADDLGTAKMAGTDVNAQAIFSDPAALEKRVTIAPAVKGTPVINTMLAPEGAGSGMQALIPEGKRAVTVEINEFSGVAGNLIPGCHVDIVSTFTGDHGEMLSRTIVQNLKVQSLGMRQGGDPNDAPGPVRSVTLIASPNEAEALELATSLGHPRMVLRASGDEEPTDSEGITVAELRRGITKSDYVEPISLAPTTQPGSQQSTRSHMRQIKIIRGGVESNSTVEELAAPIGPKWITGANTEEIPSSSNPQ
jgi:pilus assembly protein CpaB